MDVFREYPTRLFGLATGQSLNLFMTALGLVLWVWFAKRPLTPGLSPQAGRGSSRERLRQDIPRRYGKRHLGLRYSRIYPPVSE